MKRTLATLTAAVLLTTGFAFAQQSPVSGTRSGRYTAARTQQPNSINQRRENQQDRIAQGVRSGQLTARETARVERGEARINHQIRRDRARNEGRLTGRERNQITRGQNRMSREIDRDKHNSLRH